KASTMLEFDGTKAAIITIVVGIIGFVININVARAVRKCNMFGYAFGMLCLSQTISNIGNCLVFIFMAGGITLIHPDWHYTYAGRRLGQLLIFFWEASIVSHLFISANRAVAVIFPTRYNRIFGDKNTTRLIVGAVWLISVIQAFPYTFPVCSQQFDPVSFTLAYAEGWCGKLTQTYGDLLVSIVVILIICFLDITSFIRLCQLRKAHSNHRASSKEVRLFFQVRPRHVLMCVFLFELQACAQSLVLMFCECSFFFLSYMNESPWYAYASTTFIWVFTHGADGIVVIAFSSEIRRLIIGKSEKSTSTVHPSPMPTLSTSARNTKSSI
uniref:G_PROTEIN_RECEP_F1_2 domain-containing protein n=1 Tax=Steinernema glaseri TaxID=37863 RepID=A0A1I8AKC4_9BILA